MFFLIIEHHLLEKIKVGDIYLDEEFLASNNFNLNDAIVFSVKLRSVTEFNFRHILGTNHIVFSIYAATFGMLLQIEQDHAVILSKHESHIFPNISLHICLVK